MHQNSVFYLFPYVCIALETLKENAMCCFVIKIYSRSSKIYRKIVSTHYNQFQEYIQGDLEIS